MELSLFYNEMANIKVIMESCKIQRPPQERQLILMDDLALSTNQLNSLSIHKSIIDFYSKISVKNISLFMTSKFLGQEERLYKNGNVFEIQRDTYELKKYSSENPEDQVEDQDYLRKTITLRRYKELLDPFILERSSQTLKGQKGLTGLKLLKSHLQDKFIE